MAVYSERELSQALELVWNLLTPHLSDARRDELTEQHQILNEIDRFGAGGPAGLGLGRCGGHAVGDGD